VDNEHQYREQPGLVRQLSVGKQRAKVLCFFNDLLP